MVNVVKYSPELQNNVLYLLMTRSMATRWDLTTLPKIGFLAFQDEVPAACIFLRMVEGGYGQIDSMVTNLDLSSEARNEAILPIVNAVLSAAKELELKGIIAITTDDGVVTRANELGFKIIPQTVLSLPL